MTEKSPKMIRLTIEEDLPERLDLWLGGQVELSRSQLKRLIDQGLILVNGSRTKSGYRPRSGDEIMLTFPEEETVSLQPEKIPLEIVYQDEALAIINKPKGLVVHAGPGNPRRTLVNALLFHVGELAGGDEELRPGIVHRLDKDTSGLMMVAKTEESYNFLLQQLKNRTVERHYLALVQGVVSSEEGIIDKPIGRHPRERKKMAVIETGREAQTKYVVKERFARHTLVRCSLVTGRTHQIRVHMASIHHPIVGDQLYGFRTNNLGATSQVLQAVYLAFQHPNGQFVEFSIEPDEHFRAIMAKANLM